MQKVKLPVIFRRKYYAEEKQWELFAVFPTIPAKSSNWYDMEAQAENGDSFACNHDFWQASRHCRNWEASRVSAFVEQIKEQWENDSDFPCELVPYARMTPKMRDERESEWRKGRAAK